MKKNIKSSLIITTINKPNRNIKRFSLLSKKKNWNLIIIGDHKSPKNFKINHGNYLDIIDQKRLEFKFSKICPLNSYTRKNIGYLLAIKKKSEIIIETDDDNYPKNNFFSDKKLKHNVYEITNKNWINIYDFFINKSEPIWPRGLPLDKIRDEKIKFSKNKKLLEFYLQQGVCEGNPDVDAIYRLLNPEVNINFKNNKKVSLGNSYSTFNSQNTTWFKEVFPLMYLPVTCTMRSTDIWRSIIALKIMLLNNNKILFGGPTMSQFRNKHDLIKDFIDEIPMFENNKLIFNEINNLKLKKGKKNYTKNMKIIYKKLVNMKLFKKNELKYLNAWIYDCEKISSSIY